MSTKCASCGVETTLEASFFKGRKSFSRLVKTYCPTCWLQRQHSTVKWVFLSNLGIGAVGLLFWLAWPELGVGRVFINLLFLHIFTMLTILPHELGHAWMARWLGMRVFKIYLGSGTTVFTFRLFGFDFEFRAIPMGGLVVAAHRSVESLRLKQFAFILAGPAVNVLLAAAIWPFLDSDLLWGLQQLEEDWQLGLMFFYANLAMVLENLLPHNVATLFGPMPSDGRQLCRVFFLSREERKLYHAMYFVMETTVCHEAGDNEGARRWVEKGLAQYPDHEALLNWRGVIALDLGEYNEARACFLQLRDRGSKLPLMRPLMLNNIAYTNALLGGDDLLKEADALSLEAMDAIGWMPAVKGTRGTVLAKMGRFEEALSLLHESMSQAANPNHKAQNACLMAEAECHRGNLDAARTYLEEARKLDPKCSLLSRAEAILREAKLPAT